MKLPEWYDDTEEVTPDVQPKGKVRPEWYTPEETSDERKKAIKDIVESLPSEQQETITPRVQASVYLADRLDMKPSTVFRNFDTVAKEFWQTTTSPQGAMDSIRRAWDIGTKEYDLGKLSYRKMMGEDVDEQIQELKDAMPAEDQKKRAFPASFLKSFARMAPITAGGMRRGAQEGLALGAGGAAAAAIGGQLGPQAAFAEELVTIPGAFVGMFGVGATKGTMQDIGQVEAGLAYDEMVGEGIPHRIAMAASSGVGVVNAALETMQIKRVPGADALIDMALRRGVRNVMRNGAIRGAAAEFAKSYTKNIPEQVLQELAQETTNVLATETAKEFANLSEKKNIDKATGEEIANRMVETAKESAKAFTVMGLPGAVGSSVHAAKSSKQLQSATDNVQQIDIEEEIWNKLAEAEGGDLDDLVAAINEQTGQQDRMETSVELTTEGVKVVENGKAKKVDFEVDDDAVTISSFADMEPVTARNTLAKIQTEYPDRMLQFSEAMENAPKVKRAIEDLDQNARILNFELDRFDERISSLESDLETQQNEIAAKRDEVNRLKQDSNTEEEVAAGEQEIEMMSEQVEEIKATIELTGEQRQEIEQAKEKYNPLEYRKPWKMTSGEFRRHLQGRAEMAEDVTASAQGMSLKGELVRNFNATEEEAQAGVRLVEAVAAANGEDVQEYMSRTFRFATEEERAAIKQKAQKRGVAWSGAHEIAEDGRSIIAASNTADFSTFVHEMGHVLRRTLTEEQENIVAEWAGAVRDKEGAWSWNEAAEENFADGFVEYLQTGQAPDSTLQTIFEKIAEALKEIVHRVFRQVGVTDEVASVFDEFFEGWSGERAAQGEEVLFQPAPPVNSEAFQQWFGDSKVVDEEGTPLVVYHGSLNNFMTFRETKNKKNERGFFFSPDPEIAARYAGYDEMVDIFPPEKIGGIYPVYLKVENPKIIDFEGDKYGRGEAIQQAIEEGHDGAILKNHYDAGGIQDQYVAFEPTQIKSVYNKSTFDPDNPDILFQEEMQDLSGKNMVVYHNIPSDMLERIDEIGGMPMPSLAVTRKDLPYKQFGDSTLIGTHKLFNEVYDRDVWSPTVPDPEYSVYDKKLNKIEMELQKGKQYVSNNRQVTIENASSSDIERGPRNLAEWLRRSLAVRAAYLMDQGKEIPYIDKRPEAPIEDAEITNEMVELVKNAGDASIDEELSRMVWDSILENLKKAPRIMEEFKEDGPSSMPRYFDSEGILNYRYREDFKRQIQKVVEGKTEPDYKAMEDFIEENTTEEDTQQWVYEKLKPAYSEPFVQVGKQKKPYTAENLLENMDKQGRVASQSTFMDIPNLGKIASIATKELSNIEEIKADSANLRTQEEVREHMDTVVAPIDEKFRDLAKDKYAYEDTWESNTDARKALFEYIKGGYKKRSESRMVKKLRKWDFNVSEGDEIVDVGLDLIDALVQIPTDYYEAKPNRVVSLDEFRAVVLPMTDNSRAREIADKHGLDVVEYDKALQDDRIEKTREYLEEHNEVLFQRSPEHEEEVKRAVDQGYPVPDHVLKEYSDTEWAAQELERRQQILQKLEDFAWLATEARNFGDFDDEKEFAEYAKSEMFQFTAEMEDPTFFEDGGPSDQWLRQFWRDAQEEEFFISASLDEGNKRWLEQVDRKFIEQVVDHLAQKYVGKKGKSIGVHGYFVATAAKWKANKSISEDKWQQLEDIVRKNPTKYREILSHVLEDDAELQRYRIEEAADEAKGITPSDVTVEPRSRLKLANQLKKLKAEQIQDGSITQGEIERIYEETETQLRKSEAQVQKLTKELRKEQQEAYKRAVGANKSLQKKQEQIKELEKEVRQRDRDLKKMSDKNQAAKERLKKVRDEKNEKLKALRKEYQTKIREIKKEATAKKNEAVKKERERQKEIQARKKEAQKLRDYKKKLARAITRPVPKSVHWEYREQVEALQAQIDPNFRSRRTHEVWAKRKDFFERNPEVLNEVSPDLARKLQQQSLDQISLEELEGLYEQVEQLIQVGKTRLRLQEQRKKAEARDAATRIAQSLLKGEKVEKKEPIIDSSQTVGEKAQGIYYSTIRPSRLADMLDGGADFKGFAHKVFIDEVNEAYKTALQKRFDREAIISGKMKELGLTMKDLAETRTINGVDFTVDQILDIYAGSKNELKWRAIVHGNNIDHRTALNAIASMSEAERQFADSIMGDYEDNYHRLRKAHLDLTNEDMGKEANYTPMRRTERDYTSHKEELSREILLKKSLRQGTAWRGMTKGRMVIGNKHQRPIRLGLYSTWAEQVNKQEHYISSADQLQKLNRIMRDDYFQDAVEQQIGKPMLDQLQSYINRFANPSVYKSHSSIDKMVKKVRNNVAIAYLAFNMVTMVKQVPSLAFYMQSASPADLLAGLFKAGSDWKNTREFIEARDPQMRERAIERDLEELKALNSKGYQKIQKAISDTGMKGILFFDKIVTTAGWISVYDKHIRQGYSEEEAIKAARDTTLRTQPQASAKDISDLYAQDNILTLFTQFSNQLNQIWNMATYDMPAAIRQGQYWKSMGIFTSMALSGLVIWMLSERRPPEDPEDWAQVMTGQFLNMIPVGGPIIARTMDGWSTDVSVFTPAVGAGKLAGLLRDVAQGKDISDSRYEYVMKSSLEGLAIATGLPYVTPRRMVEGWQEDALVQTVLFGGKVGEAKNED